MPSATNEGGMRNAEGGIPKPSFVILRHVNGKYSVVAIDELMDPADRFYQQIKRNRGEVLSAGKSIQYSHAWLVLRGRVHKPLVFI